MNGKVTDLDVLATGAARLDIAAYQNAPLDYIFDVDGFDATGATFDFRVYEYRGATTSTLFSDVTFSVQTQTFQQWLDAGYYTRKGLPRDMELTDNLSISTFTLTATIAQMQALPETTEDGYEKSVLHFELFNNSTQERIVEGDFTVLK